MESGGNEKLSDLSKKLEDLTSVKMALSWCGFNTFRAESLGKYCVSIWLICMPRGVFWKYVLEGNAENS